MKSRHNDGLKEDTPKPADYKVQKQKSSPAFTMSSRFWQGYM